MVGHIQREKWGDLVVVVGGDNQAVRRLGLEHKWRAGRGRRGVMLRSFVSHGSFTGQEALRGDDQSHGQCAFDSM